jgi:hypothetical protein
MTLFCGECEKFFGEAEWYASILMAGATSEWQRLGLTEKGYCIYGVDYNLARRFVLGIAYKAHLSPSPPFHKIKYHTSDFDLLRQMLLNADCDDLTLPIIALRYKSTTVGANAKAIIIPAYMPDSGPVPIFSFLAAGWDWFVFFNGKGEIGDAEFLRMQLSPGSPLYAPVSDIIEHPFVQRMLKS